MARPDDAEQAYVDISNLRLAYGERRVFSGLSCSFARGKIGVVLGASGVGKSTLLRVIASLQRPDWGEVWVGDREITALGEAELRAFRRNVGMMFQKGALLDSMTVYENLALPLREHTKLREREIAERAAECFAAVGLQNVENLRPAQLSGGMIKRVALARALIVEPEILLCDEPFSGLDPVAVRRVEALLCEVNKRFGATMIISNHHIGTTLRMADHVAFLCDGGALCGTPAELRASRDSRLVDFFEAAGIAVAASSPPARGAAL